MYPSYIHVVLSAYQSYAPVVYIQSVCPRYTPAVYTYGTYPSYIPVVCTHCMYPSYWITLGLYPRVKSYTHYRIFRAMHIRRFIISIVSYPSNIIIITYPRKLKCQAKRHRRCRLRGTQSVEAQKI